MKSHKQAAIDQPTHTSDGSLAWELEGPHSGALLDFRRLIHGRAGFSLLFLQYNDPFYRDKLIPYLNRYAANPLMLRLDPEMEYSELEKRLFDLTAGHDLIQVVGLSEWLAGESRSAKLRGFNYHRELLAERMRAALALWMTENDIREFALEAPDMWAWRQGVIDFSVARQEQNELERFRLDLGSADFIERQRRMKEIELYLACHPDESISRANLLHELGQIKRDLGRFEEALEAFTTARAIYRRNDFRREHAFVIGEIARIYVDKGNVEQALKLHQEELEVYEQLGDKRSRAVALGGIARIYVGKGDVEQALKLHQERLGVFEQLGDKRELAVTLGDIARIYVGKGDVEQALKLHQEELEVYEQLGDKRSRAVTLGDIARIYVDKGDVEQALKLHQERLGVFEQLGDMNGIANSLWSIAQIETRRKNHKRALQLLTRSYEILLKLGRLDGICHVGIDYGRLLCSRGETERGVEILRRSEEGFRRLGRGDLADRVREIIGSCPATRKKKRSK